MNTWAAVQVVWNLLSYSMGVFFFSGVFITEREGVTTMILSKDFELVQHNNNEHTPCNNLFFWMLLTALANRRRDNNPHPIRGIMYSMYSVAGRADVHNYIPHSNGRCSRENHYAENHITVFLVNWTFCHAVGIMLKAEASKSGRVGMCVMVFHTKCNYIIKSNIV